MAKKNSADVGWYAYDAFGRRVARTTFSGSTVTTHYVFAPDGKLLAEHDDATGNVIKEYVWLGDMVVAMIDSSSGSPVTYFVHTGAMDEPLVLTDASKAKVWDAYVDPYGDAQTFGAPTATINLRLPGQYYQAETGLLQNWMRDYDPSLGRYIQVDPIGLAGGQNVYPYVDGRPTEFFDFLGLAKIKLPNDPSGLPPGWVEDPRHQDPNGQRMRGPNGEVLDFHRGRKGANGWKGKNHWHHNGGKEHLAPGDEVDCPDKPTGPKPDPKVVTDAAAGLTVWVILYWVISEGSRVIPIRNAVPIL